MTKVLVSGACGRMGRAVLKAVIDDADLELVGAVDINGGADTGDLAGTGKNGVLVETGLAAALERLRPDVMIDFTRPDVVYGNVLTALAHKVSPVVGTTGLTDEQKAEIKAAAEANDTPAFIAPNFAIGAVLMMLMSRMAAKYMPDVEIIELHHDNKLDAPSGTAVQTAAMIAEVRAPHVQGPPDEEEKIAGARGAAPQGTALLLAHSAPHAGVLVVVEGPLEADGLDLAGAAHGLGLGGLRDRGAGIPDGEEQLGVDRQARGFTAPIHLSTAPLSSLVPEGKLTCNIASFRYAAQRRKSSGAHFPPEHYGGSHPGARGAAGTAVIRRSSGCLSGYHHR